MVSTFDRIAIAIGLYVGVAGLPTATLAAESIVVGQPTAVTIGGAYFTAAMELGFFKEENIEPKMQEFLGGSIAITQVATKSIQIAWTGPDPLILARQPGRDPLPLKFFYNGYRDYIWQWVVPQDSPLKSLSDLKGKKVGVGALANSHMPISQLILKDKGLTLGKDFEFIPIGIGGPAFRALLKGDVDVYNTWNTNIASFEAKGTRLRRLPVDERFENLFSPGYAAHADTFKERPEMLAGFGRAVAKGTIVCTIATEWCVKTFWKYYPNQKPREGTDAEILAEQVSALTVNLNTMLYFPKGQVRRFGEFPAGAWRNYVDTLFEGGQITSKDVDLDAFYTNDLVPAMNKFDVEKVEALARTLK